MSGFFAATGRFAVRFRWAIVAAWLAATIAQRKRTANLPVAAKNPDMRISPWVRTRARSS